MHEMGYGSWMHDSWMSGGGLGMIFVWLLPLALIIALIVYLPRIFGSKSREKSNLDILKERYARGEIGTEEFEEKKRTLSS